MPINTPLISVIIPNYNCAAYLKECLESVLQQSYKNMEIIVVDDGSTDNSKNVLLDYGDQIRLFSTSNMGASAARNYGISKSKGEFVAFLDSDDVWEPNKLNLQIEKITNDNCDLIYTSSREFYGNGVFGEIHRAQFEGDVYPYFKKYPSKAVIVQGCSGALLRVSLLKDTGNFDEAFSGAAEDWDFFRRYSRNAVVGFLPQVMVNYRKHGASIMTRPTVDWYSGNTMAIVKMFSEDSNIGFWERRSIWVKFQFVAMKTFMQKFELFQAFVAIAKIFLPIAKI